MSGPVSHGQCHRLGNSEWKMRGEREREREMVRREKNGKRKGGGDERKEAQMNSQQMHENQEQQ